MMVLHEHVDIPCGNNVLVSRRVQLLVLLGLQLLRSISAANCTAQAPLPSACTCVPCNPMPTHGHCRCTETCVGSRPCAPGFEHCGPAPVGGPVYHLHTRSGCGENDPKDGAGGTEGGEADAK